MKLVTLLFNVLEIQEKYDLNRKLTCCGEGCHLNQ